MKIRYASDLNLRFKKSNQDIPIMKIHNLNHVRKRDVNRLIYEKDELKTDFE